MSELHKFHPVKTYVYYVDQQYKTCFPNYFPKTFKLSVNLTLQRVSHNRMILAITTITDGR